MLPRGGSILPSKEGCAATMEPPIEYATTRDGVRIATLSFGEGPPLVITAVPPWSHVLQEFRIPPMAAWLWAVAERARIIRYDGRGTGLSDRDAIDFSVEAQVRDLEAVAEHHALDRFAIWGAFSGSPAAIVYAARHADRVSHLLLWSAATRHSAFLPRGQSGVGRLLRRNWELYTNTHALEAFGWRHGETAAMYAELMRASITQDAMIAATEQLFDADVTAVAQQVTTPTMVIARRDAKIFGVEAAREMAALIPHARLVVVEGSALAEFLDDTTPIITAIHEFMSSDARPQAAPMPHLSRRELQVLRLIASGRTNREISDELSLSQRTVARHIANIYDKIDAHGKAEATAYAVRHGIAN